MEKSVKRGEETVTARQVTTCTEALVGYGAGKKHIQRTINTVTRSVKN